MALAAWHIEESGPRRLSAGVVELEKHLETWIENDPGLIDPGLFVLRRQMHIEGGILDLLCVDQQGRPTIVEIKRGKLIRETIAQGIDYASSIAGLSEEALSAQIHHIQDGGEATHPGLEVLLNSSSDPGEREVAVIVVGIGREPGLERMIDFLGSRFGFPIRAVTFDIFDLGNGDKVLVREETEAEDRAPTASTSAYTVASVVETAGGPEHPNGRRLLELARAAGESGLYVRPYKWSLMFTPATTKTRYLFTVWRGAQSDLLSISYSATALAEFFPISAERAQELIGLPEGTHRIRSDEDADAWERRIRAVLEFAGDAEENAAVTHPESGNGEAVSS